MVFVIIDGLDASGKSTQASRLYDYLTKSGRSVYLRIHPSDDRWTGLLTRRFLRSRGRKAHLAAALLYILDVVMSTIFCPWRRYDYIIFVRYLMGTAYLPKPLHKVAYLFFGAIMPKTRFMFFLDVQPEEAHRRIVESRIDREMFESPEELKKVGEKAIYLAYMDNWIIIDANKSEEEIENHITQYFEVL
jgi:dTMP kinase